MQAYRLPYRPLFSVDRKTWGRNFRWWLFRDKTGVVLIKDKVQKVESGNESRWEINVLGDGLFTIVFRSDRVGCS